MARQEGGSSHRINGDETAAANGRRSVESTPQSGRRALSPPDEQLTLGRHARYQLFTQLFRNECCGSASFGCRSGSEFSVDGGPDPDPD
jgi:hypothetical protein